MPLADNKLGVPPPIKILEIFRPQIIGNDNSRSRRKTSRYSFSGSVECAAVAGHQFQIALEEAVDRLVGISGHAGNEQHMRVVDGGVRTLADIPADDEIDAAGFEPARDLLVVGIVKRDGLFFDGLDILDGVNGKLRGMAEMLHHFAILAGNCNFHSMFFLSGLLLRRQRLRSLL